MFPQTIGHYGVFRYTHRFDIGGLTPGQTRGQTPTIENYRSADRKSRVPGTDLDSLALEDLQLVMMRAVAQIYMTENVFFQYESGYLPEDHWQKSRAVFKGSLRRGPLRRVYENDPSDWRESFGELIEEILAEIDAEGVDQ